MHRSHRQLNKTRRVTAWLLMLVCAWLGTGGVLNHTEEFATPPGHAAASLHGQTAAAPGDACAACEWTQGLQGRTLAVFRLPAPLFLLRLRLPAAAPRLAAHASPYRASRAPPVSFAA
jgi:hypothetical protein